MSHESMDEYLYIPFRHGLYDCMKPGCTDFTHHDHCLGVTQKGKKCKNRLYLEQYCHFHIKQAKCFIPKCKTQAICRQNYCFSHI